MSWFPSQVPLIANQIDNPFLPPVAHQVLGFGVDPALRISVFDELTLGEGFDGVTQVQGFHSESRAFHFQGTADPSLQSPLLFVFLFFSPPFLK